MSSRIGRHLAARVQADDVAGNQVAGRDFHLPAAPAHQGGGACQLLQRVQSLLGRPSWTTPTRAFTRMTARMMAVSLTSPKKHGDGGGHEENENQRVVQLLQKAFRQRLAAGVLQDVLPADGAGSVKILVHRVIGPFCGRAGAGGRAGTGSCAGERCVKLSCQGPPARGFVLRYEQKRTGMTGGFPTCQAKKYHL